VELPGAVSRVLHQPLLDDGAAGPDLSERAQQVEIVHVLEEDAGGALVEARLEERPVVERGQDHRPGPGRGRAELAAQIRREHVGQAEVEDDQIRLLAPRGLECRRAVVASPTTTKSPTEASR
jgi:hypothetical protein